MTDTGDHGGTSILIYRDAKARVIRLVVPWGDHTGDIPPPVIAFSTGDFVYQGTEEP